MTAYRTPFDFEKKSNYETYVEFLSPYSDYGPFRSSRQRNKKLFYIGSDGLFYYYKLWDYSPFWYLDGEQARYYYRLLFYNRYTRIASRGLDVAYDSTILTTWVESAPYAIRFQDEFHPAWWFWAEDGEIRSLEKNREHAELLPATWLTPFIEFLEEEYYFQFNRLLQEFQDEELVGENTNVNIDDLAYEDRPMMIEIEDYQIEIFQNRHLKDMGLIEEFDDFFEDLPPEYVDFIYDIDLEADEEDPIYHETGLFPTSNEDVYEENYNEMGIWFGADYLEHQDWWEPYEIYWYLQLLYDPQYPIQIAEFYDDEFDIEVAREDFVDELIYNISRFPHFLLFILIELTPSLEYFYRTYPILHDILELELDFRLRVQSLAFFRQVGIQLWYWKIEYRLKRERIYRTFKTYKPVVWWDSFFTWAVQYMDKKKYLKLRLRTQERLRKKHNRFFQFFLKKRTNLLLLLQNFEYRVRSWLVIKSSARTAKSLLFTFKFLLRGLFLLIFCVFCFVGGVVLLGDVDFFNLAMQIFLCVFLVAYVIGIYFGPKFVLRRLFLGYLSCLGLAFYGPEIFNGDTIESFFTFFLQLLDRLTFWGYEIHETLDLDGMVDFGTTFFEGMRDWLDGAVTVHELFKPIAAISSVFPLGVLRRWFTVLKPLVLTAFSMLWTVKSKFNVSKSFCQQVRLFHIILRAVFFQPTVDSLGRWYLDDSSWLEDSEFLKDSEGFIQFPDELNGLFFTVNEYFSDFFANTESTPILVVYQQQEDLIFFDFDSWTYLEYILFSRSASQLLEDFDYSPFFDLLFYFFFLIILVGVILMLTFFFSPRIVDFSKESPYECGFDPWGDARTKFDVQFYLVALLFLVFDLEVVLFFPWVFSIVENSSFFFFNFAVIMFFFFCLALGFFVEWSSGVLTWGRVAKAK